MWPFKKKQSRPKVACCDCKHIMFYNISQSHYQCSSHYRTYHDVIEGPIRTYAYCQNKNRNGHCKEFEPKAPKSEGRSDGN